MSLCRCGSFSGPAWGIVRPVTISAMFRYMGPTKSKKVALNEVTYVPWGEWFQPTAFRKNARDVLKFDALIFWNVKVT
jgi:hypothetical protein